MPARERLLDLLAERATQGLDSEEAEELSRLLVAHPEQNPEELELAAAAVALAFTSEERMPGPLFSNLEAQARAFTAGREAALGGGRVSVFPTVLAPGPEPSSTMGSEVEMPGSRLVAAPSPSPRSALAGWGWLAAAAALALAMLGWWPRLSTAPELAPGMGRESPQALSPAAQLDRLLREDPRALRLVWSATEDPAAVAASGEVIWSQSHQKGFMRIVGLPENDPLDVQYQLWIFDRTRDERHPVDGGVFDIGGSGEVVVPIDAKLRVNEATLFAITIEKPGGVVVSSRERLPLLAQI